PNPRQDGPDVQDKDTKKYNKHPPFMIGYGSKRSKAIIRNNRNWILSY
ncbi:unnamed protein product, partial [marine sediment metagenome]